MKNLSVPSNMTDILKWSFGNKFEGYFVTTIAPINVFDYPLLVNKTVCKGCGYVAKNIAEAEIIDAGDCAKCEHALFNAMENFDYPQGDENETN